MFTRTLSAHDGYRVPPGGVNLVVLQRRLGHTTLSVTLRYVALVTDDLVEAHKHVSPIGRHLDPSPRPFRHTFALNSLRQGGNVLAPQRPLGHSELSITTRYVASRPMT